LTLRKGINPNRTKVTRFTQEKWGPGTKAGKKEGRPWGAKKRKREGEDDGSDLRNEKKSTRTDAAASK
jgi:hypothetical protein